MALPPKTPPRFVPTLTEVVPQAVAAPAAVRPARPSLAPAAAAIPAASAMTEGVGFSPGGMEEYLAHRIMQRVNLALEQRLRAIIASAMQEQTQSVLPRLREEITALVREAVADGLAKPLDGPPPAAKG